MKPVQPLDKCFSGNEQNGICQTASESNKRLLMILKQITLMRMKGKPIARNDLAFLYSRELMQMTAKFSSGEE